MNNIALDDDFINFIKKWEGFRKNAYLDQAGIPTIGYGTTSYCDGMRVELGDEITEERAMKELKEDAQAYYCHVLNSLWVEQNKNQLIALLSLCYNIGPSAFISSTLVKKINQGITDKEEISAEFLRWVRANLIKIDGLEQRRKDEIKQYFLT